MFPQLAQRPPSHPHLYPQFNLTSYSLPSDLEQPIHHDLNAISRNLQNIAAPQPTRHYGRPSHFQASQTSQIPRSFQHAPSQTHPFSSRSTFGDSAHDAATTSEHMLRRKTPNGTLSAGYDGSPSDWKSDPHAMRPMELRISNANSSHQSTPNQMTGYGQTPPARRSSSSSTSWYRPANNPQYGRSQDPSMSRVHGSDSRGTSWMYPNVYRPGVDSMLNQGPQQQGSTYYLPNGAQVPTVLQPMHQPCLGPTASNDEGPFGPYWPDGAFIPYRPAALRDPRFYTDFGHVPWTHPTREAQAPFQHRNWQHSNNSLSTHGRNPGSHYHSPDPLVHPTMVYHRNSLPNDYSYPSTLHANANGPRPRPSPLRVVRPQHADQSHLGDASHDQLISRPYYPSSEGNDRRGETSVRGASFIAPENNQTGNSEDGHLSGNASFKDKILSWAHTVYVDLLASLHQNPGNGRYVRGSGAQQHPPRASIYPRPPRQPGSSFSSQGGSNDSAGEQPVRRSSTDHHSSKRLKRHSEDTTRQGPSVPNGQAEHASTDAARFGPSDHSQRSSGHTNLTPSHDSAIQSQQYLSTSDRFWDGRHSSNSLSYPAYHQGHDTASNPTANARAALDTITKLCEESSWQWVDGMLLGGCLAYGLGDYEKALRWYQNILDTDSNHVEAISNLAATLLSLNRREEAEQYWLRSVKLRPSHFEAVEHLIGLLCNDHRGKEAVDIIEFVERSLRYVKHGDTFKSSEQTSETGSETSRSSSVAPSESSERVNFDYDGEDAGSAMREISEHAAIGNAGYGSSGFMIPGSENGRILALVHAKGNMLYALGNNVAAARAFEEAVLIGAGRRKNGIQGLIRKISRVMSSEGTGAGSGSPGQKRTDSCEAVLLTPDRALQTARLVFPSHGDLPGLKYVAKGIAKKAAISTMSNSLLSLAKIFQDGMSSGSAIGPRATCGVHDILALYYLSLSLQRSPSTANNVGILLASVQQSAPQKPSATTSSGQLPSIPGVVPGSGVALALAYYNYGLNLDSRHAHLYTNLGSLLKDIGQLTAAIKMYEQAVICDGNFDIALANLANAVKDQGRISDAINYYRRAVAVSPHFAEAVCGLANALNSVCGWAGRGGVLHENGIHDRWHVDENGMLLDARASSTSNSGWIKRVVDIVNKQLTEGESWGRGVLQGDIFNTIMCQLEMADGGRTWSTEQRECVERTLRSWMGKSWEGARVVRLVERAMKRLGWHWYQDKHVRGINHPPSRYTRPQLPPTLSVPAAPTVLPFHTFTCPLSARHIRLISQRNGLRISCSTLRSPWLAPSVYSPPDPPEPHLNVGYVSSDFNNHPLAHLMQSVFGFHDRQRVKGFCYATTASDNSVHRQQIEREAPVFYDASTWSADRLVKQIVQDGIHIVVNLNGYTRGARNDVFAARPAPIQMSFMGFAGTLGAEWCDYILADQTAIPPDTLRPWRRNVDLMDKIRDEKGDEGEDDWVYSENIIYARDTFFCCDHRQSAPDSQGKQLNWDEEQDRRWEMRKELFPDLVDDAIILGNFNQLYKIEPTTFRSWLRILARIPKAVLWLLRFPDLGEGNLKRTAQLWAGQEVASRVIFTDVAPKHQHIARARVCDLFLDTPECNAHTTAADVLWSGTPLLTLPRYKYKMCSRMAASILQGALPKNAEGKQAAAELIVRDEQEYEDRAVALGLDLRYVHGSTRPGRAEGRLVDLRKLLYESRWTSALFDTRRWVRDLEDAYWEAWRKWVAGDGGDIWL